MGWFENELFKEKKKFKNKSEMKENGENEKYHILGQKLCIRMVEEEAFYTGVGFKNKRERSGI